MREEVFDALRALGRSADLDQDTVAAAVEFALWSAYKRQPDSAPYARVRVDWDRHELELVTAESLRESIDPTAAAERPLEEDWAAQVQRRPYPDDLLGRIGSSVFRDALQREIRRRQAEDVAEQYERLLGELVVGVVRTSDRHGATIDLGRNAEAFMPASHRIPNSRLAVGRRIKAVVLEVEARDDYTRIIVSQTDPQFIVALLQQEVPELESGLVEVVRVARDPGLRAKILVRGIGSDVNPSAAIVGERGSRIRSIRRDIGREDIDIVIDQEDPARLLSSALRPARIREVIEEEDGWTVIVRDDQLAQAIGPQGSNVRLAARLLETKISLRPASEYDEEQRELAESGLAEDGDITRCTFRLRSGRRCPNAVEVGEDRCGLHLRSTVRA